MSDKTEADDKISKLSDHVSSLDEKLDALNAKLSKIDAASEKLVQQSQAISANSKATLAAETMRNTMSNPSGFVAQEMTSYLFRYVEHYQSTDFRKWLTTHSRTIVEKAISSFVTAQVPMMNWYGATVTDLGNNKLHYHAKSDFPFNLHTGIPFIGSITLVKVNIEVDSDIDATTKETSNSKCHFSADQGSKAVYDSFEQDLCSSLQTNPDAYKILSPLGRGAKRAWQFLKKNTSFSYPLLFIFLATMLYPALPFGSNLYALTGLQYMPGAFGLSPTVLITAFLNGLFFGIVIWTYLRFKIIGVAIKAVLRFMGKRPTFSFPLVLFLLITLVFPGLPPATQIYYGLLRLPNMGFPTGLAIILLNGVFFGAVFWTYFRFKIIGITLRKAFSLIGKGVLKFVAVINRIPFNRAISLPSGRHMTLKVLLSEAILLIVFTSVVIVLLQPKPLTTMEIRAYSDSTAEYVLKGIKTQNYTAFSYNFTSELKTSINTTRFTSMCGQISHTVGNYSYKIFDKTALENNVITAYYITAFTNQTGYLTLKMQFSQINNRLYVSSLWLNSTKLQNYWIR